jgi:hypothetical protein
MFSRLALRTRVAQLLDNRLNMLYTNEFGAIQSRKITTR